ncbi:unnamed protein product [Effrenium voratum]|nr:unnamed protein product [Effrenium voratum]
MDRRSRASIKSVRTSVRSSTASHVHEMLDMDAFKHESRRRVTSLYSEEAGRRNSVGGTSLLAIEAELSKLQMFSGCSQQLLEELSAVSSSRMCPEGSVVLAKGDQSDSMLIVLRGTVDVCVGDERVAQLRMGDRLGETLFLAVEDYWPVQLVAMDLCMVCEVSREELLILLRNHAADKDLLAPYLSQPPHVHLLTAERMLQSPLFAKLSEPVWEYFRDSMFRRIFFPGEIILQEGSPCDLVLLARGAVSVDIAGRSVRLERRGESLQGLAHRDAEVEVSQEDALHPAVLGEMEFLGLSERVSSVKADAECHCWFLHHTSLSRVGDDDDSLLREAASLRTDPGRVSSARMRVLSIFDEAGCSPEFLQYLERKFEPRLFLQGKTICDFETPTGTRVMHIVVNGHASSVNEYERIRVLSANTVFGMLSALGVPARPERVKKVFAATCCTCHLLHQTVVVRALELFPDHRMKVLMLANGGQETDMSDLIGRIQSSPFFANTNPDFVAELASSAVDRIFMPGDLVVNEGDVGNSMFILLNGSADVYVSDKSDKERGPEAKEAKKVKQMIRVGHLAAGAIAGELAMLGISQTRSASIQAATLCVFWEVTQERAMAILDHFPEERQLFSAVIVQNLDLTVPGRLLNLPLFKSFDRKFRNLLSLYCERHAFFPEHCATRENETGDKLWIMNNGPVMLQKKGFKVKIFSPGMHFGCDNMLGLARHYCGTLVAMTVCHMLSLSRASYLHSLEQYPSKSAHQKLLKVQKRETTELREMLERVAVRKGVWQRYQSELAGGVSNLPDSELVRRLVKAWHDRVRLARDKRLKDARQHEEMLSKLAGWKQKTEESRKRIEPKVKLKELIKLNLTERGPLKYLQEPPIREDLQMFQTLQEEEPQAWPCSANQHEGLKEWLQPRASAYYRLHVWDVLRQELHLDEAGLPSSVLPILDSKAREQKGRSRTSTEDEGTTSGRSRPNPSKFRTGVKAVMLSRLLSQRPVSDIATNARPTTR